MAAAGPIASDKPAPRMAVSRRRFISGFLSRAGERHLTPVAGSSRRRPVLRLVNKRLDRRWPQLFLQANHEIRKSLARPRGPEKGLPGVSRQVHAFIEYECEPVLSLREAALGA